jgi:hypothetical protein
VSALALLDHDPKGLSVLKTRQSRTTTVPRNPSCA